MLRSGRERLLVSAALRSGSAPAPRQPLANFPAATLGGGGEGGGGGGGSGPRGRGRDEGRRPRLSAADLQRPLRLSRCNPSISPALSLPGRSASRSLGSPPFWHTRAGPDSDPTPQVPSENPHQVYRNPEDPILRTLDFREPPGVTPGLAGAGPGGSEFAKGTACDSARAPLSLAMSAVLGSHHCVQVCSLDFSRRI